MKKYLKYILAFIIPVSIFLICLLLNDIAPLGKHAITIYDSRLQYPAFFNSLRNFHLYSFNLGLGFNFFGTFAYYLANPLNLIINLFKFKDYNLFYSILIMIKMGLSSVTMCFFLSREKENNNLWTLIFSVIYSLIGYIVSYYYNVFWLDGMVMLPIILVGINNIIDKKNPIIYIISLTISIVINFYTGYMSAIFSVLYFIYKLVEANKYKDKDLIKKLIISSILATLISAFILLPTMFSLLNGKASSYNSDFTKYFAFNPNIKYLLYSFTPGNFYSTQVPYGFAQNFCTLFVLFLFVTFFFNKKFSIKTRITTLLIFVFYIICYSFNLFDYAWQFFQRPIWWQHRYSFTLSLFMIIIAYKNLMNFKYIKANNAIKVILIAIISSLILSGFFFIYNEQKIKDIFRLFIIIFSILALFNYFFIFDNKAKFSKIIAIVLIFLELSLNTFISVKQNNIGQLIDYDMTEKARFNNISKWLKNYDKTFYRTELVNSYTSNDGMLFNYNGVNYFSSARNQNVVDLLEYYFNFDVDSHCSVLLNKLDPYVLSLLDIKYLINKELNNYEQVHDYVYKNDQALGLGFMVNKDIKSIKLTKNDYYNNISSLYSKMLNKKLDLYKRINNTSISLDNIVYKDNKYIKDDINKDAFATISFKASNDMFLTIDYDNDFSNVTVNGIKATIDKGFIKINKNDEVEIVNKMWQNESNDITMLHYIDYNEYLDITNSLKENTLKNIKTHKNHLLEANIDVKDNNKVLFTTIVYEKGMKIKVNNKKVKPNILFNTFIALDLNKGKNTITIDYIPQGLIPGIIMSFLSLITTCLYCRPKICKNSKKR